jgi:phosphatidylserine/phosphatidylglycerophosphate/cardiolipin synthase-like enzyme
VTNPSIARQMMAVFEEDWEASATKKELAQQEKEEKEDKQEKHDKPAKTSRRAAGPEARTA